MEAESDQIIHHANGEIVAKDVTVEDYLAHYAEQHCEYWIIDPERQETLFYSLAGTGKYQRHDPDQSGMYQTPRLPDLKLHIPTMWNAPLPDLISIVDAVRKMLA